MHHHDIAIEKNTTWHFYHEILPEMSRLGYKTIVLEALWSDLYPTELKIFNEKGKVHRGLSLEKNLEETPEPHLRELLDTCYKHGVKVVPGGIPYRFYEETTKDLKDSGDVAIGIIAMIDGFMQLNIMKNSYAAIVEASKSGKVMSYGGLFHNNIDRGREVVWDPVGMFEGEKIRMDIFFGARLAEEFGSGYAEVDLIVPEVVKKLPVVPPREYILDTEFAKGKRRVIADGRRIKVVFP